MKSVSEITPAPTIASSWARSESGETRSFSRNCRRNSFVSCNQAVTLCSRRASLGAQCRQVRQIARQLFGIVANDQLRETRLRATCSTTAFRRLSIESSATTLPLCSTMMRSQTLLDDFEDVRAVENRLAARRQRAHQVPQHHRRRHVEPGFGLVEDHHVRVVQQRGGNDDLLPHAFRIGADALIAPRALRLNSRRKPSILLVSSALGQFAQASDQLQVLTAGQKRIEIRLLGDVAKARAKRDQIVANIARRRTRRCRSRARAGLPACAPWSSCPIRSDRGSRRLRRAARVRLTSLTTRMPEKRFESWCARSSGMAV